MKKAFEQLCTLIDEFWQETAYTKPGPKPLYYPDFYLKLYWFGLLFGCHEKSRFLARAEQIVPHLFKKTRAIHPAATVVVY